MQRGEKRKMVMDGDGPITNGGVEVRGMEQQRGSEYVRIFGVKCGSQFYRMKCPWSYSHVALSPDSMGSYSGRKLLCDHRPGDLEDFLFFFGGYLI